MSQELINLLHAQAREIAAQGINGWGNTMTQAADELERLQAEAVVAARLTGKLIDENSAMRGRIAALEAENERIKLRNAELAAAKAGIRAENEALKEDVERYRFIRGARAMKCDALWDRVGNSQDEAFDRAIDAARSTSPETSTSIEPTF